MLLCLNEIKESIIYLGLLLGRTFQTQCSMIIRKLVS